MQDYPPETPAPADEATSPPVELYPEAFSHAGLATVDPWAAAPAPAPPLHTIIWPWGVGGLIEVLDVAILALVMFIGVRFVAHNYVVDGGSMLPTFEDSDFLIVNRLAYRTLDLSWVPGVDVDQWRPFGTPSPGDVVVFKYNPEAGGRDFIKRVIAVPGQTVEIGDGVVIVDGVVLDEPYILEAPAYRPLGPEVVEPGKVFVLGDNRNNSFDSHLFGQVDQSQIIGRADFRYWPFGRMGLIKHQLGSDEQQDDLSRATSFRLEGKAEASWP